MAWIAAAGLLAAAAGGASLFSGRQQADAPAAIGRIALESVGVIDPRTNKIVGQVRIGSPSSIAFGDGAVWVANFYDHTVSRIDPKTREITRTIGLPSKPNDLAVGNGAVWVVSKLAKRVWQIDAKTGAVTKRIRVRQVGFPFGEELDPGPHAVAIGAGAVWITHGLSSVSRIDPASGRIVAQINVGNIPGELVADDDAVWVAIEGDEEGVARIDPITNSVDEVLRLGQSPCGIALGEGALWVSSWFDDNLWRIDPVGDVVSGSLPVGHGPKGVAAGNGAVWVANSFAGSVSRVDPRTRRVVRTIRLGNSARHIAVGGGAVWVTVVRSPETKMWGRCET